MIGLRADMSECRGIVFHARLHHVLAATAWAHYGDTFMESDFDGDADGGRYALSNGQGDRVWVAWDRDDALLLGHDLNHPSPSSASAPFYCLEAIPRALEQLAERACRGDGGSVATGGAWGSRDAPSRTGWLPDLALPFLTDVGEALEHPRWGRRDFFGVSKAQAQLAADVAVRATGEPLSLTKREVATLRRRPPTENAELSRDRWQVAIRMLAALNISLPR